MEHRHGVKAPRQLDWFCVRGVTVDDPGVVPAVGGADDATVLSDHDMLLLTLRFVDVAVTRSSIPTRGSVIGTRAADLTPH